MLVASLALPAPLMVLLPVSSRVSWEVVLTPLLVSSVLLLVASVVASVVGSLVDSLVDPDPVPFKASASKGG